MTRNTSGLHLHQILLCGKIHFACKESLN